MSAENVESARRGLEAFARDGVEGILEYIHPDFEMTTPPDLAVEPQTYRGHDGLRRYFRSFYEVMDEIRFEPHEFIDAGDRVVIPLRLVARGKGTGISAGQELVLVWTVRDGLGVRMDAYASREAALRAVAE